MPLQVWRSRIWTRFDDLRWLQLRLNRSVLRKSTYKSELAAKLNLGIHCVFRRDILPTSGVPVTMSLLACHVPISFFTRSSPRVLVLFTFVSTATPAKTYTKRELCPETTMSPDEASQSLMERVYSLLASSDGCEWHCRLCYEATLIIPIIRKRR